MTGPQDDMPDDDRVLAAEYVLGLLSAQAAADVEARLGAEPPLRALVAEWQEHFAALAEPAEEVAPPPAVQQAVEARLFGAQPAGRRPVAGLWRLVAGLGLAAALGLIVLGGLPSFAPQGPALSGQLAAAEGSPVSLAAQFDAQSGTLTLTRDGAAPAEGRDYELWLIVGEAAPISLGVVPQSVQGRLALSADHIAVLDGAVLAITDEPAGGSPTGQATGPILALGTITAS